MVSSVEFGKVISYYKKENPVVKIACLSCFQGFPWQKGEGRFFFTCFLIESDVALLIREQLPFLFASTIDQNRGNKATLLRSPDRVIGLAGATRQISRTRTFGLSEAMTFAYVKDSRFVLLRCLLLGLGVWWYLLPEPLLVQPTACCSPECASAIKEAAQCQMRSLGFPCMHYY